MFGAGIDSYCALIKALQEGRNIYLIHVLYGAPYGIYERRVFKALQNGWIGAFSLDPTQTIPKAMNSFGRDFMRLSEGGLTLRRDALMIGQHEVAIVPSEDQSDLSWENYIIPARNLVLAAIGSQYAPNIWIVSNKRNNEDIGTPDKTSTFYQSASDIFSDFYGYPVRVSTPFGLMSKQEMVVKYLEDGGSAQALRSTISCYSPVVETDPRTNKDKGVFHCGRCYACYKRHKLFTNIREDHEFYFDPLEAPNREEYMAREKAKGRKDESS
jgi:7-cyano-7-deazaguanine synthase in queuosine biosynthesis